LRTTTKERPSLELVTDFSFHQEEAKMGFHAPRLGALGVTFTAMRAMQAISLLTIIGLCANFINEITQAGRVPPSELIGALTVTVIAIIYIAITYILYYDNMMPLLITSIFDSLLLIGSIVVAALIGKPLSMLNCAALPSAPDDDLVSFWASVPHPSGGSFFNSALLYSTFVSVDKASCYQIKVVWGFAISLCVLFAFSSLVCVFLWHSTRRVVDDHNNAAAKYKGGIEA
ncbi:hypothetical protein B0T17DRAFT_500933, partial [Bombardia bombarda]